MLAKSQKILLTGLPGCGKTTAVMKIVEKLDPAKLSGFYTQEIRQAGKRKGFLWKRLDGAEGILAHVEIKGPHRVAKYGVDITGFEASILPILDPEQTHAELFVIDEIGRMECLSDKFVDVVRRLLASDRSVLATVAQKGGGFIRQVKASEGIKLFSLTAGRTVQTIDEVLQMLAAGKGA